MNITSVISRSILAGAVLLSLSATFAAKAEDAAKAGKSVEYPTRVVRLVVPFVPGGATDTIGRVVAQYLSNDLGQSFIVENRPGAAGIIGTEMVTKSSADGYTLLLGSTDTVVINAFLYKKLSFNLQSDLIPVAIVGDAPEVIVVSGSLPVSNLREFMKLAKEKSGKFNYGSPGIGTIPHLAGARLAQMIGTQMVNVPFRGVAAAMKEVATGEIQFAIATKASADPFVSTGQVKILAVASSKRLDSLPNVPTTAEAGLPGYEISNWWGVLAPRGTNPAIVSKLNSSLQRMFKNEKTVALFKKLGIVPMQASVNEFAERIRQDRGRWKEIVRQSGVQIK
jgi:tripartite-type tricarboxylate transporter receptor subunit TctC